MRPGKIALFIFTVLGLLLLISVFSTSGDGKSSGIEFSGVTVKYPTTSIFLQEQKAETNLRADSIVHAIEAVLPIEEFKPSIPDFSKIDTVRLVRIAWPENKGRFVSELHAHLVSDRCRILHYGDSQLEGDRISGYLRNRLQGIYGGTGPGFLPVKQVYHQLAAEIDVTDNWLRYAVFDPTQDKLPDMNYGVYTSVSRFTPAESLYLDSTNNEIRPLTTAGITIRPSFKSFSRLRQFKNIGLHYGNALAPVEISVSVNGELVNESALIADGSYHCFEIVTGSTPAEVYIELTGTISPDFYGLTLDGESGIQLDNIAMRGSSGTIFNRMSTYGFNKMAARLNPGVVILQYGGNTVPYIKDSVGVVNYTRYLSGHINWLRNRMPEAIFLFIGPGDMSTLLNGDYITYPLLPYLDKQLKRSCVSNGVAYWSMFKAMGGENSMQYWVEQQLAANDYTHFSPKGSRIISELFFNALYLDLSR